jgi:putative methionine-R-sulfoxide reductase with GAF domain
MADQSPPAGGLLSDASFIQAHSSQQTPAPNFLDDGRHADFNANVSRGLMESNFGDLEELANDIEAMSVYGIRGDHLGSWGNKIRRSLKAMRESIDGVKPKQREPSSARRHNSMRLSKHSPDDDRGGATASTALPPAASGPSTSLAPYASGALHLLLDALAGRVSADWATCFVYNRRTEELVLACSVGKRLDRAGTLRLSASSGIESHVLSTGIAVNIAHAYAEEEFRSAQDKTATTRTRSELVFPLMKPGSNAYSFGVVQLCNKKGGTEFFTEADEIRAAECVPLLAAIIAKFPNDITNPACFDSSLLAGLPTAASRDVGSREFPLPSDSRPTPSNQLVFRTARAGHVRRADVMRDAGNVSLVPSITEALGHVAKVHDAWRNAVLLNIELEKEIARLQESLSAAKLENQRLQTVGNELKKRLDGSTNLSEIARTRRQSSTVLAPM